MFNDIEKEISEIICKDPYKFCIMGFHKYNDDIYTIFVRDDIVTRDHYIKDSKDYNACRISLLYPRYVDLGYNITLTKDELNGFIKAINDNWEYVKAMTGLETIPDYTQLETEG